MQKELSLKVLTESAHFCGPCSWPLHISEVHSGVSAFLTDADLAVLLTHILSNAWALNQTCKVQL